MEIEVITLFPRMFSALNASITGRAQRLGRLRLKCRNLRDYATDRYGTVDDYPFGGEAGMVLKPEPLKAAIESAFGGRRVYTLFPTPQGRLFTQQKACKLAETKKILIICGHYKGIDERIRQKYIDEEISLGNYVLTGGELPAMCIIDSIARLLPGTLGNDDSLKTDSFFLNNRLGWPVYTRPEVFDGMRVPDVLLSGHHKKIELWRKNAAIQKTRQNRPELLESNNAAKP